MRRGVTAVAVTLVVAACSQPTATQTPETARDVAADASPSTALSAESSPGGGLIGEVTSLTGEVTPFQVTVTDTATIVDLAADVLFAFDSADLSPQAPEQLRKAADLIRQGGAGPIAVLGHTDSKGDDAYNLGLSERRALEVAGWLGTSGGIEVPRLQPRGLGEADPVAPNQTADGADNPAGRAQNRRVVIVIPKA